MNLAKTVLIVDDDEDLVRELSLAFVDEGYQALRAGNGLEAEQQLKSHHVDLLITDIYMPQKDGFELAINALRDFAPPLKILVISGGDRSGSGVDNESEDSYLHVLRKYGRLKIIAKPFKTYEILKAADDALKSTG